MSEQDRYTANMTAYVQAATARAERAEQALQAAQAENAALREALSQIAHRTRLMSDRYHWPDWDGVHRLATTALSGDAGAAFLAEREAMLRVVEAAKPLVDYLHEHQGSSWQVRRGYLHDDVSNAIEEVVASYDALSAPAAEPEVPSGDYRLARGVVPWQPGQPLAEDAIRRVRDAEPCCPGGRDTGDCDYRTCGANK